MWFAMLSGALASASAPASVDPAHGFWLTENGKAIIHLQSCGAQLCGRLAWMVQPYDEDGRPRLDAKNVDELKRIRRVCGLQLFGDFTQSGHGAWSDGWVYNPRDGATYSASIEAADVDVLQVRGYVGIKLLGKSQTWTRVEDDRGGC